MVGLGWWGKLIVEQLSQTPSLRVVVATDLAAESGKRFVLEPGIDWAESYDSMLAL
jgi:hypothetical protein